MLPLEEAASQLVRTVCARFLRKPVPWSLAQRLHTKCVKSVYSQLFGPLNTHTIMHRLMDREHRDKLHPWGRKKPHAAAAQHLLHTASLAALTNDTVDAVVDGEAPSSAGPICSARC